jgi:hypothetical protein
MLSVQVNSGAQRHLLFALVAVREASLATMCEISLAVKTKMKRFKQQQE